VDPGVFPETLLRSNREARALSSRRVAPSSEYDRAVPSPIPSSASRPGRERLLSWGFSPLRRSGVRRIHHSRAYLTPFVALSGFRTLSALCSPPIRPALFHAGDAHGVFPSEPSPSKEPYRLSAACALLTFSTHRPYHTTRPCHAKRAVKLAARVRTRSGCVTTRQPRAPRRACSFGVDRVLAACAGDRSRRCPPRGPYPDRLAAGLQRHLGPKSRASPPPCARRPSRAAHPPGRDSRPFPPGCAARAPRAVGLALVRTRPLPEQRPPRFENPADPSTSTGPASPRPDRSPSGTLRIPVRARR
jgi:hypothetical protein